MSKKQKTLLILVWNMDIGGVQKRVRDIIFYLNQHHPKIKIEFLVKNAYPTLLLKQVQKLKKVNVYYFNKSTKKTFIPSIFWLIKNYFSLKPDIILTFLNRLSVQMIVLKLLFFWHKVKLVLNEGIYTSVYLKMYESFLWERLVKFFYPLANRIIVPTKAIAIDLNKAFNVPLKKISVIPHWVITKPKKTYKKIYDFIYIGRLEKEKNIFVLLELIEYLKKQKPRVSLCILGKGSLEKQLQLKIKKRKLSNNVFFHGFQENVNHYLVKSKILLLPSLNEGMPNCVLEAAMHKVPAVVYNFKGANEVVLHGKTGFIVENKKSFFQYTKKLLSNQQLRKLMGINAQKRILNNFGEDKLKKYLKLLLN